MELLPFSVISDVIDILSEKPLELGKAPDLRSN